MHPILFYLGSFPVRSYGVFILIGFTLALWYGMLTAREMMERRGAKEDQKGVVTPEHVYSAAAVGLFLGILGTRVLYVVFNWQEYRDQPWSAFSLWKGGLTFIGAPIFAFPYLWYYCRSNRLPYLHFADIVAPGFALGQAFGRIGCFLNGCCYGHACNLPWAVSFQDERHPGQMTPPSHPVQLYESGFNLLWFVLLALWMRRPHRNGDILLGFLTLYCLSRFIDEPFRIGATSDVLALGLSVGQIAILVALPLLALGFWWLHRRPAATSPSGGMDELRSVP